jgi:hypothetical protein
MELSPAGYLMGMAMTVPPASRAYAVHGADRGGAVPFTTMPEGARQAQPRSARGTRQVYLRPDLRASVPKGRHTKGGSRCEGGP